MNFFHEKSTTNFNDGLVGGESKVCECNEKNFLICRFEFQFYALDACYFQIMNKYN